METSYQRPTDINERLQKAIERNRAKQASKMRSSTIEIKSTPAAQRPEVTTVSLPVQRFFERQAQEQAQTKATSRPEMREAKTESIRTRQTVARPNEAEFTSSVKRNRKAPPADVGYSIGTKAASVAATSRVLPGFLRHKEKYVDWLIKGSWIFCGLLLLRLIFSSGGIIDYYKRKGAFHEKQAELAAVEQDNANLLKEINRIQADEAYQKKLVRDNLGFISQDEFLILFPEEKNP